MKHLENVCGKTKCYLVSWKTVNCVPRQLRGTPGPRRSNSEGFTPRLVPDFSLNFFERVKVTKVDLIYSYAGSAGIGRLRFQDSVMFLFWYSYALRTAFPPVCPSLCVPQEIILLAFTGPPYSSTVSR